MPIEPGQQLLHYRMIEKIGEGGMGVVWKARDTNLDRDVAIKVLPASFAIDPERMTRFEREAKLLASLSHPNIATVHGLHEAEGVRFIAMEYVDGEDLAQRLSRGPMALDETVEIANKIALGMSAAHESGTIHRDLKPANVRITPAGQVKVLDFGLARASVSGSSADASLSPTMTSAGTAVGMLLGTAAYMSPEQARGRTVDRRTDVWAFGCLLYECLTGRRAFPGDTISDILAELIKSEPDWTQLPAATPPSIRRLLRRCLTKDPDRRLRDLGDAALELSEIDEVAVSAATNGTIARFAGVSRVVAAAGVLGGLALGAVLSAMWVRDPVDPPAPGNRQPRTAGIVALPDAATIAYGTAPIGVESPMLAISPDGRHVVYVGRDGNGSRLLRHDLATFDEPQPIPGTEGALFAFFSPLEDSLGFFTNDRLARVDLNGDRLQVLGDVRSPTRAIWGDDDRIYIGDSQGSLLRRFQSSGGAAEFLGPMPSHGLSDLLPGGRLLYHEKKTTMRSEFAQVRLLDVATGSSAVVLENAYDARVRGDRIFFIRNSALMRAGFDVERGEVVGDPEVLVRNIAVDSIFGQAQYAVSPSGTLAYLPGGDRGLGLIAWVDRDGERKTLPVEPRVYGTLDLSPNDRVIAVQVGDVSDYIWLYDLDRQQGRKLSTSASSGWPIWNSAGDSVTYTEMGETYRIMQQKLDSAEAPRLIVEYPEYMTPTSWSPDDRLVTVTHKGIEVLDINGKLVETSPGFMAEFSPDGHWMAHNSEQTGVYGTVVRSWPGGDRVYSIQTEGGVESAWSRNGELFYRIGNRFYVVETTSSEEFRWTPPRLAFEISFLDTPGQSYDVTSDGQRLYTIVPATADVEDRIHIVGGL